MVALGDAIGRRFLPFLSIPHRLASAFLCGLLFSSWFTYLVGYLFAESASPMFWANAVFFAVAIAIIYFLNRGTHDPGPTTSIDTSETAFARWDWVVLGIFFLFGLWMMFRTFTIEDGNIAFGHHQYPDFGSTVSIMQSFAYGNNFPTEYPHFSGDRIRYHFLFYFQAGNLEYLGLNPAAANNVLSVFSLTSLLMLVMTMGTLLFRSRVAGRIGAALFFFHGSLAFIPFFIANPSTAAVMDKLSKMTMYLNSGFPYRGEDWGVWSQNVFLNQRHFTSSIAIFLLVLIFLYIRNREKAEALVAPQTEPATLTEAAVIGNEPVAELMTKKTKKGKKVAPGSVDQVEENHAPEDTTAEGPEIIDDVPTDSEAETEAQAAGAKHDVLQTAPSADSAYGHYVPYIFAGVLLGLLPMWNGPVYLTAAVILAPFLLLFPLRKELIVTGITAAILGLPQVIYLTSGLRPAGYSMFRWGFVIDNAGLFDVLYYTFFTFGFKWVLIAIALYFASGLQRRFLAAAFMVFPLTYFFRFSEEVLANHKFLNVWLIIANVFVAFALVKLWNLKSGSSTIPTRAAAIVLGFLITVGGAIDLVPVWNSYFIKMKYVDDPLVEWARTNTAPKSIFLSQKYINHQLLLAGRRLFYGDPYYAWSAGYDTPAREALAKRMFETRDPNELLSLLKENKIDYVAIDDMIRNSQNFLSRHNEDIVAKYFPLVFTDEKKDYANIKIYKVPEDLSAVQSTVPLNSPDREQPTAAAGSIFTATEGNQPGQLQRPRGLTIDSTGNILVADTKNARIQKFDATGKFVSFFGERGSSAGQMQEPNGIAVDAAGDIYVTDAMNHRLLRFKGDGQFVKEWSGPAVGNFYGPRDLVIGPNKLIYVIDQGGTRICRLDAATDSWTMWGGSGLGESEFNEPTGIAVSSTSVFVADVNNTRVQVFDLDGKFLRQFRVEAWQDPGGIFPDLVYDEAKKVLYLSSGRTNEILVFDMEGKQLESLPRPEGIILNNPTSLVIQTIGKSRRLLILNTNGSSISPVDLEPANKK